MKIVLALVGILVLLTAGTRPAAQVLDDRAAWSEACAISGYSCHGIGPPFIAYAPMEGIRGRYRMGERYILVSEDISGPLAYAVKVHEMTHYLQWKHGKWTFTDENRCRMEKDAFDVSNRVLERLHDTKDLVDWNVVKGIYGCT